MIWPRTPFSGRDVPARRMPNSTFRGILASRSDEQHQHAALAAERLSTVTNDILAASIWIKSPTNCVGDAVVELAQHGAPLLIGQIGQSVDAEYPLSLRGAVPLAL